MITKITLLCLWVTLLQQSSLDSGLQLNIAFIDEPPSIKKEYWFFGQKKLPIEIRITNQSEEKVALEPMIRGATVRFLVFDESGKAINRNLDIHVSPTKGLDYYTIVPPKGTLCDTLNLFWKSDLDLEDGKDYYIQVAYVAVENDSTIDSNVKVFTGKLVSNKLHFSQ